VSCYHIRTNAGLAYNSDGEEYEDDGFHEEIFISGRPVPECSNTGNFHDVAHYTQIIWKDTKQVGCGYAQNDRAILVCQYLPQGNIVGQTTNS